MSPPAPGRPTDNDLAHCCRVLAALCADPAPLVAGTPAARDVLRLAGQLLRQTKKQHRRAARARDTDLLDATAIRGPGPSVVLPLEADQRPAPESLTVLSRPRNCYICKAPYTTVHPFYDCMCPACGDINLAKRRQTADLRGRTALVTGARVKIGLAIGLKLLRAGATVIATTRFPHDAARRYAAQPDAAGWADRLFLYGLDLRHLAAVERFAAAVTAGHPRLDVFIHNAAQTVRRPPAFYQHLLDGERCPSSELPPPARQMLGRDLPGWPMGSDGLALPTSGSAEGAPALVTAPLAALPGGTWAELSQVPLLPGDDRPDHAAFPLGERDADAQQVDRRPANSWGLLVNDLSTVELLEVQAVNCLAPFLLLRGLESALRAEPARDRYVVLVSAVEGQFGARWKAGRHPHTNMAKAGLNMLTRTCADAYAAERIFLTSVDTGWITNEAAHPAAERMRAEGFRPPLDAEDGAARVLDPVFTGVTTGVNAYGVFLKDYRPAPW